MVKHTGRIAAIAGLFLAQVTFAQAVELKVYSTIGVQAALEELAPKFEKASGNKLTITWGTAAMLVKRVQGGENADALVLTKQGLDALIKDGKVASGTESTFASSGMAMVVKQGASKPDISTSDAFKKALLNAKTVAYSNPTAGGASGVYFAKLLERMGIADQIKPKTKFPPAGGNSADLVASGEAELAVQQEPEVMAVKGVDASSKNAAAVEALINFLKTPEAAAVFKARGLKPAVAPKAS